MRILLINSSSGLGGAETHVAQLTRGLVAGGHEVHIASPEGGPLVAEVEAAGACHHPTPMHPDRPSAGQVARLAGVIAEVKPDVAHLHGIRAGLLGRLAMRLTRVGRACPPAVVYTVHGAHHLYYRPPLDAIYARLERSLEAVTHATIYVCRADFDACAAAGATSGRRAWVVHNALDTQAADAARMTRHDARRALDADVGDTILLAVGRLSPSKDYPTMLRAVAEKAAALRGAGARIIVVGLGEEEEHLRALAAELGLSARRPSGPPNLVTFAGPRPGAAHLMGGADALVLSSAWEGLPYVVLEAMAASLPVIATAVGGVPELVDDRRTGLLVAPGDAKALGEALLLTARDATLRRRLGEAGRRRLEHRFAEEHMIAATERVYRAALGVAG